VIAVWAEKAALAAAAAAMLCQPAPRATPAQAALVRLVAEAYELELDDDGTVGGPVCDAVTRAMRRGVLAEERERVRRVELASRRASSVRRKLRGVVSCRLPLEDGSACPALVVAERASLHAWQDHRRVVPVEDLRVHFEEIVA
jgi:hypothetical protein